MVFSALALCLTVSLTARCQSNGPLGPSFFGMQVVSQPPAPWPGTLEFPFASWRAFGLQIKWSDIEQCDGGSDPTNACYVWNSFDTDMSQARAGGQDILYTILSTPTWASSNPTDTTCKRQYFPLGSCDPPNDIDAVAGSGLGDGPNLHFDDFMTALTTHVGPGVIKYWEVWNEPNVAQMWRGSNLQLVRLAKDTWNIVKSVDANALITTPPYVGQGVRLELPGYLSAGGSQYADVVGYHGYVYTGTCPNTCPVPENELALASSVESIAQAAGLSGKPVFDTEASWGNYLGAETITDPDQQVAFTGRYYLMHVDANVSKLYWYSWNSSGSGQFYDVTSDTINSAGIAYEQLYSWLSGVTLTAPCSNFNTQWICFFTGPNGYVAEAIWDVNASFICSGGVCPTENVAVPTNLTQYLDLAGNTNIVTNAAVPVGSKPILVEGTTPNISVTMTASPSMAAAGGVETYTIVVTNNTAAAISGVTVTDSLASSTVTSCSSTPHGSCQAPNGGSVTVNFLSMASGETDTIAIAFQLPTTATGTILNTATANWVNSGGNAAVNWSTVAVNVGIATASVRPNSMNFGNQVVQVASPQKKVTVTNTGTADLIIDSIGTSGAGAAEFSPIASPFPLTIAPQANATIGVVFTPSGLGRQNATMYIYGNASNSPSGITVAGNGVSPTTTTLVSSSNPVLLGQPVTFTSQVNCKSGVTPTGSITFKRLSTVLATEPLNSKGAASYTTSSLPLGWATITAIYSGDSNCGTSKAAISQGVKK